MDDCWDGNTSQFIWELVNGMLLSYIYVPLKFSISGKFSQIDQDL